VSGFFVGVRAAGPGEDVMGEDSEGAGAACPEGSAVAEGAPGCAVTQPSRVSRGSRRAERGMNVRKEGLQKSDEGPTLSDRTPMRNEEREPD
jgi:hypothetical protein